MSASIIRGKHLVCRVSDRNKAVVVDDGAIYQKDGVIVEIGEFQSIAAKHPGEKVVGDGQQVIVPGFVNGHHHVGLTPFQLGSRDYSLELWLASRLGERFVDYYLDTLYSAFEMIESGVTTVQHLRGVIGGPADAIVSASRDIIRAYQDIGMRVSYSYALRDQNRMVYESDADFLRRLPVDVAAQVDQFFRDQTHAPEEIFSIFEGLVEEYRDNDRVGIQLAPNNLHWCSDATLTKFRDCVEKYDTKIHMHLLETAYQREYALRRTGGSAVRHLKELELLGPFMTLGHGVWLTEADIELCAETQTCICHNCSSNLRLRSGVAPLNAFEKHGVRTCIGIDEAGINDDRDMLQEMRMVLRVHRVPGMDDADVPTSEQVLRMATEHGAHTTPFADRIGVLEVGKACDLVMLNWRQISYPYLDENVSLMDAILYRAKTSGVDTVMVGGETILDKGRFTRINKDEVLEEIAETLRKPIGAADRRRFELGYNILPTVKAFYGAYLDGRRHEPFYKPSSRV